MHVLKALYGEFVILGPREFEYRRSLNPAADVMQVTTEIRYFYGRFWGFRDLGAHDLAKPEFLEDGVH